jgi:hypothetical protein
VLSADERQADVDDGGRVADAAAGTAIGSTEDGEQPQRTCQLKRYEAGEHGSPKFERNDSDHPDGA